MQVLCVPMLLARFLCAQYYFEFCLVVAPHTVREGCVLRNACHYQGRSLRGVGGETPPSPPINYESVQSMSMNMYYVIFILCTDVFHF